MINNEGLNSLYLLRERTPGHRRVKTTSFQQAMMTDYVDKIELFFVDL